MKGLQKVSARPGGGWDKIHTLSTTNGSIRKGPPPHYIENKDDKYDFLKLVQHYRQHCDPDQKRFLHHAKRNRTTKIWFKSMPVGENKVASMVKEVAKKQPFTKVFMAAQVAWFRPDRERSVVCKKRRRKRP